MEQERIIEVVASGPRPGKEAEYNQWYDEHIRQGFEYAGLKKVSRQRLFLPIGVNGPASPRYLTIYEFEKKEDLLDFYRNSGLKAAGRNSQPAAPGRDESGDNLKNLNGREISDFVEIYWAAGYEPLVTLQK